MTNKKATPSSPSRYARGLHAEHIAAWLLRLKGYALLGHRLRTPMGEIDLVARKNDTLVVVEVKRRRSHRDAAGVINQRQRQRLCRAGRFFLATFREKGAYTLRFDVILVNKWGWPHHVASAWSDDDT